jgi:hypothetical protein
LIKVGLIDRDGNGLVTDRLDQVLIDLDGDGEFDGIRERRNLASSIKLKGERYSVRSDRLGQSLTLTADIGEGKVRYLFELADADAVVETLEGCLRDETGNVIAIRNLEAPTTIPVGRYCLENLVVQVRDQQGTQWRMTLAQGYSDSGWFEIKTGQLFELQLLKSVYFKYGYVHIEETWSGRQTQITPHLITANGLVVTNFERVLAETKGDQPRRKRVLFHFELEDPNGERDRPRRRQTSYG